MGLFSRFLFEAARGPDPGLPRPICRTKLPFGNRLLTTISVWLGLERRADSPRFDTLAGEAGPGFGRATHAIQNKALAQAYRRG